MKRILLYLLLVLWLVPAWAQQDSTAVVPKGSKRTFIELGLWPGMSTQGRTHYAEKTNNISLSLIGDVTYNEYGMSISGIFNFVTNDARGVQIAGIANRTLGQGAGMSAALMYNLAKNYDGAMFALGFSSVERMRGLQMGGFNGGVSVSGVQVGFSNQAKRMSGVQAGVINFTDTLQGVQVGILNNRKDGGVQVGIVNVARNNDYPVGFINLIKEGYMSLAVEADDRTNTMLTFRSGGKVLYGLIGIGYNFRSDYHHMSVQAGWGVHAPITKRISINTELALAWMSNAHTLHTEKEGIEPEARAKEPKPRTEPRKYRYRSIFRPNLRVLPAFHITDKYAIYAGPTLSYMGTNSPENEHLFPKRKIWKSYGTNSRKQLYVGYMLGVNCSF